jgi:hypothetical protein
MCILFISTHLHDPFRKLRSFRKWDKAIDINPEDKSCYSTQYQETLHQYVKNGYSAKHRRVPDNRVNCIPSNIIILSATAAGSGLWAFDSYDLCSDHEEYSTRNKVVETTPG